MKKSDMIWESVCEITNTDEHFICWTLPDSGKGSKTARAIRADIMQDVYLLSETSSPRLHYRGLLNNFYSAAPDEWIDDDSVDFRTIRAMYCLFLYWDYLSQGD